MNKDPESKEIMAFRKPDRFSVGIYICMVCADRWVGRRSRWEGGVSTDEAGE